MPIGEVGHREDRALQGGLGDACHRVADVERELLKRVRLERP